MFHLRSNKPYFFIRKLNAVCRSESGQSVILVSVVILSFLMFFGFAINTGLLITAKISLQNAADAAAYAGAATQARQMNAISFLNYDMRRQYKKFLFRYNFVGSIGSPEFPTPAQPNASGDYDFPKNDFSVNGSAARPRRLPIKVPVVCIPLTTAGKPNDNCLQINLPNTANDVKDAFPAGGLTAITTALLQQINQIQSMQTNLCKGQGQINLFVLITWLFRGDTDPAALEATMNAMMAGGGPTLTAQDKASAIATVKALVHGLGLYPRNIINLMRIETLEKFLNQPAQKEVSAEKVKSLEGSAQAESYERTIQAFKSASANLNAQVMDPENVIMTELQSDQQMAHEEILANFNAYVQMMSASNPANTICNAAILPFPAQGAPVGIRRNPSPAVTHYAVKLRAKAKLLFLPIRDGIELEAVGAAKPFGSRLGPSTLQPSDFVDHRDPPSAPQVGGVDINKCDGPSACNSPNVKIGGSNTFYTANFLKELMTIAKNGGASFGYEGIMKAQRHAMAPMPTEVGVYNILPPAKSKEEMSYEFIPYSSSQTASIYRFYAPIYAEGQGNANTRIQQFLDLMFATTSVGQNAFGISPEEMKLSLSTTINGYIQKLESGNPGNENGESLTFAAIELPMAQPTEMKKKPEFWLTEANEVLSSWGPRFSRTSTGTSGIQPRFGYSVKFVTMQNLLSSGMADSDGDLEKVSH